MSGLSFDPAKLSGPTSGSDSSEEPALQRQKDDRLEACASRFFIVNARSLWSSRQSQAPAGDEGSTRSDWPGGRRRKNRFAEILGLRLSMTVESLRLSTRTSLSSPSQAGVSVRY
jgi:hypothetical protein